MKTISFLILLSFHQAYENSVELRECSDTIELRERPKLRGISSRQCHKEVNTGQHNTLAHLCQTNECASTWTRCVQLMAQ